MKITDDIVEIGFPLMMGPEDDAGRVEIRDKEGDIILLVVPKDAAHVIVNLLNMAVKVMGHDDVPVGRKVPIISSRGWDKLKN